MKLKITYRKGAKPIILESNGKSIREIAKDCAHKLAKNYQVWRTKEKNPITPQALKRYEIGQEFMMILKLEEYARGL